MPHPRANRLHKGDVGVDGLPVRASAYDGELLDSAVHGVRLPRDMWVSTRLHHTNPLHSVYRSQRVVLVVCGETTSGAYQESGLAVQSTEGYDQGPVVE